MNKRTKVTTSAVWAVALVCTVGVIGFNYHDSDSIQAKDGGTKVEDSYFSYSTDIQNSDGSITQGEPFTTQLPAGQEPSKKELENNGVTGFDNGQNYTTSTHEY